MQILYAGGVGCISASANLTSPEAAAVYAAWKNGGGEKEQERVSALRAVLESYPSIATLKYVFAKFVEQDRRTMELQAEGLKHNPHLMLIDDADRPAKWYFQLKAAHLEAKRTGAEMKHPMTGPVTLKWRS